MTVNTAQRQKTACNVTGSPPGAPGPRGRARSIATESPASTTRRNNAAQLCAIRCARCAACRPGSTCDAPAVNVERGVLDASRRRLAPRPCLIWRIASLVLATSPALLSTCPMPMVPSRRVQRDFVHVLRQRALLKTRDERVARAPHRRRRRGNGRRSRRRARTSRRADCVRRPPRAAAPPSPPAGRNDSSSK